MSGFHKNQVDYVSKSFNHALNSSTALRSAIDYNYGDGKDPQLNDQLRAASTYLDAAVGILKKVEPRMRGNCDPSTGIVGSFLHNLLGPDK